MAAFGAAAAMAVAGCGSQVGTADHGQPPKLHIGVGAGTAAGEAVPSLAAASGRLAIFGGYVLAGELPTSPTHAPVWRWPTGPDGAATRAQVTRLGSLLGLAGTPQRHPHGWLLATSSGELRVSDGESLAWSYVRGQTECPPYEVDIDSAAGGGVGCAEASAVASAVAPARASAPAATPGGPNPPPGAPNPPPVAAKPTEVATPSEAPAPSDEPARALLSSLGVSGAEQSQTDLGSTVLTVDPTVGSLPTQGIATSVIVDAQGIRSAIGHLGVPKAGADYPLRAAKAAFADLGSGPRPMIAQNCGPGLAPVAGPEVAPSDMIPPSAVIAPSAAPAPQSCPSPQPIRVTGAALGLLATWDGGPNGPNVLVPAWFFTVGDSPYPLAVVAVDPAFIAGPPTPDAGTGSGSGASSVGSSGSGGAPAPTPTSVPPAPAATQLPTGPPS